MGSGSKVVLGVILGLASAAYAKDPKPYQTGKLLQMDSVKCGVAEGVAENDAQSPAGEMLGPNSTHKKTQKLVCQEYVLQTERVIYRIRPRAGKHPVLLPVGERAQFRMQKDRMLLRVEERAGREREYIVVSMSPPTESSSADATPARLNHLQ
jgi:hypothetical protein